ncbi:MAG: toprim domain-containing protein [Chitinophagaceae bacterium]
MNCEEANQIDLVNYLSSIGHEPAKIRGNDYWYISPLRQEKEASFKVNKNKNVWYDHGIAKGGNLVDFATEYYRCNVSEALQKISLFHPQKFVENIVERPPVHLHQHSVRNEEVAGETAIKIIAAKKPITDLMLCSYLRKRKIDKSVADKYCYEVTFTINEKERVFRAIGFKNNAGGYELRNEFFKSSSSPKSVSYFDNNTTDKIKVFEGFFDFLSYQTINQNQQPELTNFLVLNSLAFFERSLLVMEKHKSIHLYLDNDTAGRKCTLIAQERSLKI